MSRIRLAAPFALGAACLLAHPAAASARTAPVDTGSYIVVYERSVSSVNGETDARERRDGFRSRFRYGRALKGFSARLSNRQVQRLKADPEVAFVSPDRIVRATSSPIAAGDSAPTGVRRVQAASATTARDAAGVNVAVIDTGVDLANTDLNATAGKNCVGTSAPNDDNGHGTHVAGTIGARNNGAGVLGVAPGTRLYAVKVLNKRGSGTWSQVICGIDWVTATRTDADTGNDVAVANMSLGGVGDPFGTCASTDDALYAAICRSTSAGVNYVVAAGNDGWDFDYARQPDTPAAYPEVLTVTAVSDSDGKSGATGGAPACRTSEVDDRYASFSNYALTTTGRNHVIAGPGVCINSTWPGGTYRQLSGTSMATPHLAGAVALCLREGATAGPCDGLTPAQVIERMRSDAQAYNSGNTSFGFTGDPLRPVSSRYYGYLTQVGVTEAPPPPDTTAPAVSSTSPADAATGVAPTANVSVTFSEPMDKASAESAFSLTAPDGSAVGGTFSWADNTMTFDPASDLAKGASYTAKVATGAKDPAGNAIGSERAWTFTISNVSTFTAFPGNNVTIETGTARSTSATTPARLDADDGRYYEVNSASRVTAYYGTFSGVSNDLVELGLSFKGRNSRSCTQTLGLFNWETGQWVTQDSRSVGSEQLVTVAGATGAPLADFVSGTTTPGDVRIRVRCEHRKRSFYASGNLLKLTYDAP